MPEQESEAGVFAFFGDGKNAGPFEVDASVEFRWRQQYFQHETTPEEKLMLAVLEDAVHQYRHYAFARHRNRRFLFEYEERWFHSSEVDWLYSFQSICNHFGFSASSIRRALREWRERGE